MVVAAAVVLQLWRLWRQWWWCHGCGSGGGALAVSVVVQ
jgi:hypothetical protein